MDQPARLKKQKFIVTSRANQMIGLRTRCNPPFGDKNKLAEALTKGNSTLAVFRAFSPTPASAPGLLWRYRDKDLQRATKLALKLFVKGQEHGQLQVNSTPHEQPLKTWFLNLYYGNSHLDCYCFCQQYENYFKTAKANRSNQVFFAVLFLYRAIVQQCHQQKRCFEAKDPITQEEFKDFL